MSPNYTVGARRSSRMSYVCYKKEKKTLLLRHQAFLNNLLIFSNLFITGIQEGLITLSEELAAGKLVKNLTLFPALQITLVHPDMTREFEHACQVLYNDPLLLLGPSTITQPQDGMRLFYDITFPVGKLFVTILTFVNACYEGKKNIYEPIHVQNHHVKILFP